MIPPSSSAGPASIEIRLATHNRAYHSNAIGRLSTFLFEFDLDVMVVPGSGARLPFVLGTAEEISTIPVPLARNFNLVLPSPYSQSGQPLDVLLPVGFSFPTLPNYSFTSVFRFVDGKQPKARFALRDLLTNFQPEYLETPYKRLILTPKRPSRPVRRPTP